MSTGTLKPQLDLFRASARLQNVEINRNGRRLFLLASCKLPTLPVDETSTYVAEDRRRNAEKVEPISGNQLGAKYQIIDL